MNLIPGSPIWLIALLFAALAAAAIEDFVRLKISNLTCIVVLIGALIAVALHGFSLDLWQNALVFVVLLAAGTPLFSAGKMGGGDVKLLACTGLWVNIGDAIWLLATTFIAGGVLALIYLGVRYWRMNRTGEKYKSKGIPYGIAIAAGASLVFAGQAGLLKSRAERVNPLAVPISSQI